MRASSGRITAMAIGIPIALGSMGWGAFSMVGQLSLTSEHHEVNYPWHGGSISLNVDSGSVRVEVGSDSAVGVAYTEHYELKKPTVTSSVSTDGVAFKARCPGGIFDNNCFTNFVLTVPAAAQLTIHSGNGGVHLTGVTAFASIDAGNGGITLDDVSGDIVAHTGNGGIRGSQVRSTSVQATTGDGGIVIDWAVAPKAVVTTTGNGGVRLTVPSGSGPYRVDARTGNGSKDISVRTDPSASSTITAHTGDGGVNIGYP